MFVYLTYCLENGKAYIGKYEGSETSMYLGSGKLLKRAIKKYGKKSFTRVILERYNNREECREGEKKWIQLFDAVDSTKFYNIAKGGEGGDTYTGIIGDDRVKLQAKLKKRKHRKPPTDQVAFINLLDGKSGSCSTKCFYKDRYKVGVKCKGLYKTPAGIFSSLKIAHNYTTIEMSTLRNRCINSTKVINKNIIGASNHLLKEHDRNFLNKTFFEAGYDFLPISTILKWNTSKIKQLNIIKK